MKDKFNEIMSDEFDCIIYDLDFVIKKEGTAEIVFECMNKAFDLAVVNRSKTLENRLINKRDKLKKERIQIQSLINNNNSMSYDYIFDKTRMIPFLNSQISLLNELIND